MKCDCQDEYMDYVYPPHGHVHTGCLDIIQCEPLRRVMSMGAKFRLKPSVSKTKIISIIETSLLKLKRTLAKKCKHPDSCFDMWYDRLMKKIRVRVNALTTTQLESQNIFEQVNVKQYLKQLHVRFVIVPVDKASNNFAIICKKFYIETLMKELGINQEYEITGNKVYKYINISSNRFFKQQEQSNKKLDNTLNDENRHIPLLYWTSKQHKNPFKFRFIAGASHCYNKTISVEVALALKCIKTHFKNYCGVIKKHLGLNFFWSIDNSIEFLNKLGDVKSAVSIKTYDFSTLYTNLPLDKIYENLEKLIIKMFNNSGRHSLLINADRKKAFWSQGQHYPGYKIYTIDKLLDALKFILYNTYVQFAGNIFKQIQGIPMGGNASPFIADLCLAWDEYCFMYELSKSKNESDNILAKTLSSSSRYIDDIATINYLGFGDIAKRIYHPSLILEESTFGYHYDTFLDLNIRVYNNKFIIGIYHKVDDFDFKVINFPFPESNIHSKVGYNAFYSQLVRFFRLCNNVMDFLARVKMLFRKLESRGYSGKTLSRYFLKFCNKYPANIKYGAQDGNALWLMITNYVTNKTCSVYDYDAIDRIVRPCEVVLKDIYFKEKAKCTPILKPCVVFLDNIDTFTQITPSESRLDDNSYTENTTEICSYVLPVGLANPRNHCYINSVLQIIHRILLQFTEGIHINSNPEGCLVKTLLDTVYSNSNYGLSQFKLQLARFNPFFDGTNQQDAYECLISILDILHLGTKENLVDDVYMLEDDQFINSLTKQLFSHTTKRSLKCVICRYVAESYSQSYTLFVYPYKDSNMTDLLNSSMMSDLIKKCDCCQSNTKHEETVTIVQPPKFLAIIVNRFDQALIGGKNKSRIRIDRELQIASDRYNLVGSIHHYGASITSGHYITNVYYHDVAYTCNDSRIVSLNCLEPSDSVYMTFYTLEN